MFIYIKATLFYTPIRTFYGAVKIRKAVEEVIGNRVGRPKKSEELESGEEIVRQDAQFKGVKTRDIAAKKAGFGGHNSYAMAKYIVENAPKEKLEAVNDWKK